MSSDQREVTVPRSRWFAVALILGALTSAAATVQPLVTGAFIDSIIQQRAALGLLGLLGGTIAVLLAAELGAKLASARHVEDLREQWRSRVLRRVLHRTSDHSASCPCPIRMWKKRSARITQASPAARTWFAGFSASTSCLPSPESAGLMRCGPRQMQDRGRPLR